MAEGSDLLELQGRFQRMLECPICFSQFNLPKVLPCQHTFCRGCLGNLINSSRIKCPICRKTYAVPKKGVDSYPPNVTISELLELQSTTNQHSDTDENLTEELEHLVRSVKCLKDIRETVPQHSTMRDRSQSVKAEISKAFEKYRSVLDHREHKLLVKVDKIVQVDSQVINEWDLKVREKLDEAELLKRDVEANASNLATSEVSELRTSVIQLSADVFQMAKSMPSWTEYYFTFGSQSPKLHLTDYGSIVMQRPHVKPGIKVTEGEYLLNTPLSVDYYPSQKASYISDYSSPDDEVAAFTPFGVAVSPVWGDIVTTDIENHRVHIFSRDLKHKAMFGCKGAGPGELNRPTGVTITKENNIYVADQLNHRIQLFDSNGKYLSHFAKQGSSIGELVYPCGLATDSEDNIYVCDSGNFRVQVFKDDGTPLYVFGNDDVFSQQPMYIAVNPCGKVFVSDSKQYIRVFTERQETYKLYMSTVTGVAVDSFGHMVVGDCTGRMVVLKESGETLCHIGTCGKGPGQMVHPQDVSVTVSGDIVLADKAANRLQVFNVFAHQDEKQTSGTAETAQ